jgi:four helix bundle protein
MTMPTSYKDLPAWQRGVELAKEIYYFSKEFPVEELDGLTQMMRRTAVLVPCKIASGHAIAEEQYLRRNLVKAEGLLYELETQVTIAHELKFCTADAKSDLVALIVTEQRLVGQLINKLDRKAK